MLDHESSEIIQLLVSLVFLFSAIALFVFISQSSQDYSQRQMDNVSTVLENAQFDQITALDAATKNGDFPLVSVISNELYELADSPVLYVHLVKPDGTNKCYASSRVTITGINEASIEYVESPCYSAARDLLSYSSCHASVELSYEGTTPCITISSIREV